MRLVRNNHQPPMHDKHEQRRCKKTRMHLQRFYRCVVVVVIGGGGVGCGGVGVGYLVVVVVVIRMMVRWYS